VREQAKMSGVRPSQLEGRGEDDGRRGRLGVGGGEEGEVESWKEF
jgi:hypothetical protein